MKIVVKEGSAVVAGVIGAGVGPLAGDSLDEALGLAIGLWAIGPGEAVLDAQVAAGGGEELGAVSGAAVGEQALDLDAVVFVEGDGLAESVEGARDLFIGVERGEGEAGVVVNGDVEAFDAGTRIAVGAVAGGADAGACEAAQLLDVEVEELAGMVAFVADRGRFGRLERSETIQAVAAQNAGKGGFGNGQDHADLSVGTTLAAQLQDLSLQGRRSLEGLLMRSRRAVVEAGWEALRFCACEPAADRLFADAKGGGGGSQRAAVSGEVGDHFGSRQWGESGISVHVVRAGFG